MKRQRWIPATMVREVSIRVPMTLTRPGEAAQAFLAAHDPAETREVFKVASLDVRRRVTRIDTLSVGCLASSLVHPREVFLFAVRAQANGIILSHNHPSGDPEPSAEDISLTRRLVQAGQLMGIEVLDHVVLGGEGRFVSFKERGML